MSIQNKFSIPVLIRKGLLSWLFAATFELLLLPKEFRNPALLDGLQQISLLRIFFTAFLCLIILFALSFCPHNLFIEKIERIGFPIIFSFSSILTLQSHFSLNYFILCLIIECILVLYSVKGWIPAEKTLRKSYTKENPVSIVIVTLFSILFFLFVSIWGVCRVYTLRTQTYDLGLFSQMFYYMKECGRQLTTLERDGLLSHFQVHVSPIYYLLLPFYLLYPHPTILPVLQAAVLTSAVVPLWKLGKHHGLSNNQCVLLCSIFLLFPALSGGAAYDLHENCFLAPLLLWLLYGIDQKSTWIVALSTLFVLMVKEDAGIYTAVIGLYLSVHSLLHMQDKTSHKPLITGVFIFLVSCIIFFCDLQYLSHYGDGVMIYRYVNFFYESDSLFSVIKAVILNPFKVLYECVTPQKMFYLSMTFFPLLGIPFLTRHYERLILLIPYVLVNLMPSYEFQYNILYQYSFGSTVLLFYLLTLNLAEWSTHKKQTVLLMFSLILSAYCFATGVLPTAIYYPKLAYESAAQTKEVRNILNSIPPEASVASGSLYSTWLSQREILYDIQTGSEAHIFNSDYIVLDPTYTSDFQAFVSEDSDGYNQLFRLLEEHGYLSSDIGLEQLQIFYKDTK